MVPGIFPDGKPNCAELTFPCWCGLISTGFLTFGIMGVTRGWIMHHSECHASKESGRTADRAWTGIVHGGEDWDRAWKSLGPDCGNYMVKRTEDYMRTGIVHADAAYDDCYNRACAAYCSDRTCNGEATGGEVCRPTLLPDWPK